MEVELVNLLHQAASALAYASELNMLHLDVQPKNFHVSVQGEIRIANFGMIRISNDSQLNTKVGTMKFKSTEETMPVKMDHKTDIWCLGATFLEAFSLK